MSDKNVTPEQRFLPIKNPFSGIGNRQDMAMYEPPTYEDCSRTTPEYMSSHDSCSGTAPGYDPGIG